MRSITSAVSNAEDPVVAARECAATVKAKLSGRAPDLVCLFVSQEHAPGLEEALPEVVGSLAPRHLVGCTAEGVIEGREEHERRPALALWAAVLPGVDVSTGHVCLEETADGQAFLGAPAIPDGPATMLLFGEPYSFPPEQYLGRLKEDHPELQVLGGMASGARAPGENRLFLGGELLVDGAVAVVISGGLRARPVVSQGCRPFGKPLVVTRAEGNFIRELGGRPAWEKLKEQMLALSPQEQKLLQRGLHLGIAIDARRREHRRGDFLVRNVMGFSREDGSIAVTDLIRTGSTVQFQMRDAETATEDLEHLLRDAHRSGARPLGALLFSCNGRGTRLFAAPGHDAGTIARELGDLPLAGFFAAGEIGPVGGQNFLHGFTASLALFEDAD